MNNRRTQSRTTPRHPRYTYSTTHRNRPSRSTSLSQPHHTPTRRNGIRHGTRRKHRHTILLQRGYRRNYRQRTNRRGRAYHNPIANNRSNPHHRPNSRNRRQRRNTRLHRPLSSVRRNTRLGQVRRPSNHSHGNPRTTLQNRHHINRRNPYNGRSRTARRRISNRVTRLRYVSTIPARHNINRRNNRQRTSPRSTQKITRCGFLPASLTSRPNERQIRTSSIIRRR